MNTVPDIRKVDFGSFDAESEHRLNDYFVDTGVFTRISSGRTHFIIGRKGSGKTAIFRRADEGLVGHPVIKLDFEDYSWTVHSKVREEGVPSEASFVASWKFIFLVNICKHWCNTASDEVAEKAMELLQRLYGGEDPGALNILADRLRRLRRFDLPTVAGMGGGGVEFSEDSNSGPVVAQSISLWNQRLLEFVEVHYTEFPFSILADRLDDGWDATPQSGQLLAGALKAARSINASIERPYHASPVIIFLRQDIYDALRFNDKNKSQGRIEWLRWSESNLIAVAEQRVARSLGISRTVAWNAIFTAEELRQRASARSYILSRTMHRPRDIIAFCTFAQVEAEKRGHSRADREEIYAAEESYSKHIYDELIDETEKRYPHFDRIMQTIRAIGVHRFSMDEWNVACEKIFGSISDGEKSAYLRILFEHSIVGVPRTGGKAGGTTFVYLYNDPLLQADFSSDIVVHRSLIKYLSIREAQRRTTAADAGSEAADSGRRA